LSFWQNLVSYFHKYFSLTTITVIDVIEIIIIAILFYYLMIWFKKTRAWALFKGILVILIVVLLAAIFNFTTILFIASKTVSVGIIALIIIFQPELRRALEQLGRRNIIRRLFSERGKEKRFSNDTLDSLLNAVEALSDNRVGALIVIEQNVGLNEYIATGITMDSVVSRQLVQNIFIDKSPLHDGAIIVRDDRIVAATCYLPLSNTRNIDKKYGTRHRAAVGMSEVSDAFSIVVSEETGAIAYAVSGEFRENVHITALKNKLLEVQEVNPEGSLLSSLKKGGENNGEDQKVSEEVDRK